MSSLVESPEYQAAERFVDLTLEKRALRARLDRIEKELKRLETALGGYLSALGQKRFVVRDCLLYPQREPWVYPRTGVPRQMVCEALKMSGLARMVTENYSTQSLTKYIKDLEDHHKLVAGLDPGGLENLLPPGLAGLLVVVPAVHIRVKQSKEEPEPPDLEETYQGDEFHE